MKTHGGDTMAHGRISPLALLVSAVLMTTAHPGIAATQKTAPVTGHAPVAAPELSNLTPQVGDTITVTTNFTDTDGDSEDTAATGTSYQWQAEKTPGSGDYEDITGQTGKTWTATEGDAGKRVRVAITPRTSTATTEPFEGEIAVSDPAEVSSISEANSDFTVTTLAADNTITAGVQTGTDAEKATLVLTLRDNRDVVVTGKSVTFDVTPADPGVAISAVTAKADGTYTAVLTGTKAQAYTVAARVGETALTDTKYTPVVTVAPGAPDAQNSVIISDSPKVEGDNITITATLADKYANTITPETGKLTIAGAATNGTGFTLAPVTDTQKVDGNSVQTGVTSSAYPMDVRTARVDVAYDDIKIATVDTAFAPQLDIGTKTPQCKTGGWYKVSNYSGEVDAMLVGASKIFKDHNEITYTRPGVTATDPVTGLTIRAPEATTSTSCGLKPTTDLENLVNVDTKIAHRTASVARNAKSTSTQYTNGTHTWYTKIPGDADVIELNTLGLTSSVILTTYAYIQGQVTTSESSSSYMAATQNGAYGRYNTSILSTDTGANRITLLTDSTAYIKIAGWTGTLTYGRVRLDYFTQKHSFETYRLADSLSEGTATRYVFSTTKTGAESSSLSLGTNCADYSQSSYDSVDASSCIATNRQNSGYDYYYGHQIYQLLK